MILLYFYSHNPVAALVTDWKLLQVSCGRSLFDSRSFYRSGHNRTSACQHGRETPLSMTALEVAAEVAGGELHFSPAEQRNDPPGLRLLQKNNIIHVVLDTGAANYSCSRPILWFLTLFYFAYTYTHPHLH